MRNKSHDSIHTTHFLNGHLLQDDQILSIAITESRIIVTKDNDFLDNFLLNGPPPRILLLQFGNISNNELLTLFDSFIDLVLLEYEQGVNVVIWDKYKIVTY